MKINIKNTLILCMAVSITFLFSCKKEDEGEELSLDFKKSEGYTYSNQIIMSDTSVTIGIVASTTKKKDPIIRFNISESINDSASFTVVSKNLDASSYDYDYTFDFQDIVSGNTHNYIFTITNKDGKIKQKSLTLTAN